MNIYLSILWASVFIVLWFAAETSGREEDNYRRICSWAEFIPLLLWPVTVPLIVIGAFITLAFERKRLKK